MAKKKQATAEHEKTLMEKIGEQASHLKEEIIAGKDHLIEAAENKIASVKETIKKYQARRKKAAKKVTKKSVNKAASAPVKKAVKKIKKAIPKKKVVAKKVKAVKKKVVAKVKKATKK